MFNIEGKPKVNLVAEKAVGLLIIHYLKTGRKPLNVWWLRPSTYYTNPETSRKAQ